MDNKVCVQKEIKGPITQPIQKQPSCLIGLSLLVSSVENLHCPSSLTMEHSVSFRQCRHCPLLAFLFTPTPLSSIIPTYFPTLSQEFACRRAVHRTMFLLNHHFRGCFHLYSFHIGLKRHGWRPFTPRM